MTKTSITNHVNYYITIKFLSVFSSYFCAVDNCLWIVSVYMKYRCLCNFCYI